ncbi:MAG: hypothetical protein LBP59_11345 [Planctomycetaceae bacterium]|nr:hypothetical protein [Planctomycetaceae bacterium]
MRLYSTANERGLTSQPPFCLPIDKLQARRLRSSIFVTKKLSHLSLKNYQNVI